MRAGAITTGLALLAVGGVAGYALGRPPAPVAPPPAPVVAVTPAAPEARGPAVFTAADVAAATADPAAQVPALYAGRQADLVARLGPGFASLTEDLRKLAFATVLAHEMKPYGGSTALDLPDLLAEDALDCDNYAALAWHLLQTLQPSAALRVAFVGWDGGAIGNHAQLIGEDGAQSLLADPTLALFARTGFDALASGRPVAADAVWSNPQYDAVRWQHGKVRAALRDGGYRPADLLYYFAGFDAFRTEGVSSARWATPAIARRRLAAPVNAPN